MHYDVCTCGAQFVCHWRKEVVVAMPQRIYKERQVCNLEAIAFLALCNKGSYRCIKTTLWQYSLETSSLFIHPVFIHWRHSFQFQIIFHMYCNEDVLAPFVTNHKIQCLTPKGLNIRGVTKPVLGSTTWSHTIFSFFETFCEDASRHKLCEDKFHNFWTHRSKVMDIWSF
jgi:hypothetical protein